MTGTCDKCKEEKKIVQRIFLFAGDEEPLIQYCEDCFNKVVGYYSKKKLPNESTAYGISCPGGKCEM